MPYQLGSERQHHPKDFNSNQPVIGMPRKALMFRDWGRIGNNSEDWTYTISGVKLPTDPITFDPFTSCPGHPSNGDDPPISSNLGLLPEQ